jgi:hypothetical protein
MVLAKMINRFFKCFSLKIIWQHLRMFDFVMKMFSEGDAAIPALGMEEIPKQLAKQLEHASCLTQRL